MLDDWQAGGIPKQLFNGYQSHGFNCQTGFFERFTSSRCAHVLARLDPSARRNLKIINASLFVPH